MASATPRSVAEYLNRLDFIILDELGYLPFAQAGGQILFHLISRLRAHLDHRHDDLRSSSAPDDALRASQITRGAGCRDGSEDPKVTCSSAKPKRQMRCGAMAELRIIAPTRMTSTATLIAVFYDDQDRRLRASL